MRMIMWAMAGYLFAGATAWGQISTTLPTTLPTTLGATTEPTTQEDPLARPDAAVLHLFKMLNDENYESVRQVCVDSFTVSEVREHFASTVKSLHQGAAVSVADYKQFDNVAVVIMRDKPNATAKGDTFPLVMIKRFDVWKVMFGQPNPRRLTTDEKSALAKSVAWANGRLDELHGVTTRPATKP